MGAYSRYCDYMESAKARAVRLRAERLREARKKGTHTRAEWLEMLDASGHVCCACGSEVIGGNPTKDHIIPISLGGSDSIRNLQPLCRECNAGEAGYSGKDFRIGKPWMRPEWDQEVC